MDGFFSLSNLSSVSFPLSCYSSFWQVPFLSLKFKILSIFSLSLSDKNRQTNKTTPCSFKISLSLSISLYLSLSLSISLYLSLSLSISLYLSLSVKNNKTKPEQYEMSLSQFLFPSLIKNKTKTLLIHSHPFLWTRKEIIIICFYSIPIYSFP